VERGSPWNWTYVWCRFFILGCFYLFQAKEYSYKLAELDTVNFHTIIIFLGPTIFEVASIASLFHSIKTLRQQKNRLFAAYLLLTSISLCVVMFILLQNGWIGLRTWAM